MTKAIASKGRGENTKLIGGWANGRGGNGDPGNCSLKRFSVKCGSDIGW